MYLRDVEHYTRIKYIYIGRTFLNIPNIPIHFEN